MLEIQNIFKTFNPGTVNEKRALNGLSLHLNAGDFVTVIGGNGAGKSTMLNAVAGVWPVDEGKILIDGQDVTRLGEHQRAAYIGRVFQDPMTGHRRNHADRGEPGRLQPAGDSGGGCVSASPRQSGSAIGSCCAAWTSAWRTGSPPG